MAISPYLPAAFPVLPAALLLLSELAELILVSPRIRLLEASLCRTHYLALDPPVLDPVEALCKLESIQTRLAYIRGWQVFFEAIPVMLLAVPWGALADRVGKKRVLAVNFMGCAVHIAWFAIVCRPGSEIAVEWVWGSALAFCAGGGPRTAGVLILALVNDTAPGAERSERFYYTYSAYLVTELVALPLASLLMGRSIMLPFVVALVALGCCFPVLASVQAARSIEDTRDDDDSEAAAGLLGGSEAVQKPVVTTLRNTIIYLKNELSHAVTDSNILLVLLGHFICPVRQELVFQILIPYTSKRFTMPISKAGLILSLVASINLLIFILVLPAITRYLRVRRSFSASRIDTLTASTSSLLLAFGCILIGAASTLPLLITTTIVFAAGFGIRLGLLSLLSSLVDPAKIGRVYTLVTVVEGFGEMVSAPVLQGLWAWGLGKGGGWMGAPWWGGAVVYAAGWWFIGRVHVRGERRDG